MNEKIHIEKVIKSLEAKKKALVKRQIYGPAAELRNAIAHLELFLEQIRDHKSADYVGHFVTFTLNPK